MPCCESLVAIMGSAVSASSNSVDESMRRKIEAKVEASAGYTPEQCVKFCADLRAVLALSLIHI